MNKLMIISFSVISRDPRVLRQIEVLADNYDLEVVGFGPDPGDSRVSFVNIDTMDSYSATWKILGAFRLLSSQFESFYWNIPWVMSAKRVLEGRHPVAVIANDISALPLAFDFNVPVLYDAHEYSPREYEESLKWRIFFQRYHLYVCEKYLPQVASMTTVCKGIRDEYHKIYGVCADIVHNAPFWKRPKFRSTASDQIKLIHHGAADKARQIDLMIDMMDFLDDRFSLSLMLVGEGRYLESLKRKAQRNGRIRFLDPVKTEDICDVIAEYDVGVYILKPTNFNNAHALPNKFFEFIQAGLALAIGPSPEMKAIVEEHGCGVVSDSFDPAALAEKLNRLSTEDIDRLKEASIAASRVLGFESDAEVLRKSVYHVVG